MATELDQLIERGTTLFSGRGSLLELWQEIGEQFYPQRADFTNERWLGEEFADHTYTGYPMIVHRDLANAFSSMLRPTNVEWFKIVVEDDRKMTTASRQFLEWAGKTQRRAMYDRRAQFVKASKEGDNDFAAFGQCVISREIDWKKPALLYRNWHLRDCAWAESYDGSIGEMHRKWTQTLGELKRQFGKDRLSPAMQRQCDKASAYSQKVKLRVTTVPSEDYGPPVKQPWKRLVIDVENKHVIEETAQWNLGYIVPRWQTVSGSQYAYSPATITGLPDARLIQAMTLTLLEAGEMAVRPPLVAIDDAIREDLNWYSGGITIADAEYDQRLGDVIQPISQDSRGLPFGVEMREDLRNMLATAFFLNKIALPPMNNADTTAYEVSERIQEYIREAAPLFEPMEYENNAVQCEDTFDDLMRAGVFGPPQNIPEELRGANVQFQFESPLHDAIERKKGNQFMESREMLMMAAEIDAPSIATLDVRTALRDAMHGIGTPAHWLNSEDVVAEHAEAYMEEQQQAKELQAGEQAAGIAKQAAEAEAVAQSQ